MSPPPETHRNGAARWLRLAVEDLALGQYGFGNEDLVARGACVWAHQAGEKAVKALLVIHDIDPPKRHDLVLLCRLLPDGEAASLNALELHELSRWAIEGRYPDDLDEATRPQAAHALEVAGSVIEIVKRRLAHIFEFGVG